MSDLVEFLNARLAEDEEDARSNRGTYPSAAAWEDGRVALRVNEDSSAVTVRLGRPVERPRELIALKRWTLPVAGGWTDTRALREIEAKRRIIEEHPPLTHRSGWDSEEIICDRCRYDDGLDTYIYPCRTLVLLAAIYSVHADYREEWAP